MNLRKSLLSLLALVQLFALVLGPLGHARMADAQATSVEHCGGESHESSAKHSQDDCCRSTNCHGACAAVGLPVTHDACVSFPRDAVSSPATVTTPLGARSSELFRPPIV